MKPLALMLVLGLTGCGLGPWYVAHQTEVLAVGAIGGAVYAVEQAAGGAIDLEKKVRDTTKGE